MPSRAFKILFMALVISTLLQRLFLGTEYDGVSQRLEALLDLAALIDIEQLIAFQMGAAALLNDSLDLACQDRFGTTMEMSRHSRILAMPSYLRSKDA